MIVVIPMAGRGSRFSDAGFDTPKPLIEVAGKRMIFWALESLKGICFRKIVFVCLREHEKQYQIRRTLDGYNGWSTEFVFLDEVTEGQLCTVLDAREHFSENEDILVAASDSFIKSELGTEIKEKSADLAGLISVISLPGEHWSFAKTDAGGKVIDVAEKRRISDHCSTGMYYFSSTGDLMRFGRQIIEANERTNNEFYIIPVYKKMVEAGLTVRVSIAGEMWDMGNPEAKNYFETNFQKK